MLLNIHEPPHSQRFHSFSSPYVSSSPFALEINIVPKSDEYTYQIYKHIIDTKMARWGGHVSEQVDTITKQNVFFCYLEQLKRHITDLRWKRYMDMMRYHMDKDFDKLIQLGFS